jgi:hypothetical protein
MLLRLVAEDTESWSEAQLLAILEAPWLLDRRQVSQAWLFLEALYVRENDAVPSRRAVEERFRKLLPVLAVSGGLREILRGARLPATVSPEEMSHWVPAVEEAVERALPLIAESGAWAEIVPILEVFLDRSDTGLEAALALAPLGHSDALRVLQLRGGADPRAQRKINAYSAAPSQAH